jgi:biopolymer transport protein ExbD
MMRKKYGYLILNSFLLLFFLTQIVYSKEILSVPNAKQIEQEEEKIKQEQVMIKKEQERIRNEELEFLKTNDPQEYKKRKDTYERQDKINQILDSFRKGSISSKQAEQSLYPLVKDDMQGYISTLDTQIEHLEKRLDSLKKAKRDPNMLIKERINQMLGKEVSSPESF